MNKKTIYLRILPSKDNRLAKKSRNLKELTLEMAVCT